MVPRDVAYENLPQQFDVSVSIFPSSSCRLGHHVAEEAPPNVPWRVSSLPVTALVGGGDITSAVTAPAGDGGGGATSLSSNNVASAVVAVGCGSWTHSSNSAQLLAASSAVCHDDSICGGGGFDASCSSSDDGSTVSAKPSKGTSVTAPSHVSNILVAGRISEESSSCDSTLAARAQTEVVGAALREQEALVGSHQGLPRVLQEEATSPPVKASHTPTLPSFLAPAPPPTTDVAPCDRRGWRATPWLTKKHATGAPGQFRAPVKDENGPRRKDEIKLNGCSDAAAPCPPADHVCERRHASRVPAPPRQTTYTPRPIWAVLRTRTLKVARQDPSIFRDKTGSDVGHRTNGNLPETSCFNRWHILSRKVFGVREVQCPGTATTVPDWMVFSGGAPPSGTDEHTR